MSEAARNLTDADIDALADALAARLRRGAARDDSELLTPREAAELLGVSTRTLREYAARGLQVERWSSRVVRYRRAELERFAGGRGNGRE